MLIKTTFNDLFDDFDNCFKLPKNYTNTVNPNYKTYDIKHKEDGNTVVRMNVAGFTKEDIDVRVNNTSLLVKAEKEWERNDEKYTNSMSHTITLKESPSEIKAELLDGFLYIDVIYSKPKKIKVDVK